MEKTNYLPQVTDKINHITLKTTSRHERDSNSQLYVFINHIHIYIFCRNLSNNDIKSITIQNVDGLLAATDL
jgi:hypothetical protein